MLYESIIRVIRDQFRLFPDANAVLDQTIHRENHVINRSVDDELDFGDFNNEIIEPLELGDINNLTIPTERISTTIQSASTLEESVINSAATNSLLVHKLTSEFQLKSESKGNRKKKTLFIYKNEMKNPPQTSRQAISVALQTVATKSQTINQNVLDVVANNEVETSSKSGLVLLEFLKSVEDLQN